MEIIKFKVMALLQPISGLLPGLPLGNVSAESSSNPVSNVSSLVGPIDSRLLIEDDDITDLLAEVNEKNFFFQARYVLVTYKTWLDKNTIINWFMTTHKAKYVRVAHEIGTKKIDYEHSHVFVDFGKHVQRTNPRCFDYMGIHPNIGPIRFQKHLNRIYKYMCKYDHSNDDMLNLVKREWCVEDVWECKTVQEALRNVREAKEVSAVIQTFSLKPRPTYQAKEWLYPWHVSWEERVMNSPGDYRSIHWIHERIGNTGKSYWAKEMYSRYPTQVYVLKQMGGAEKCATIISNAIESGWTGHCLIVDLPRNAQDKSIYEPLESIRDGMITTTRYSGRTFTFEIRWVIVLANFPPETFSMSQDRWKIHDHNTINPENAAKVELIERYKELVETVEMLAAKTGDSSIFENPEYLNAIEVLKAEGLIDDRSTSEESEEEAFQPRNPLSAIQSLAEKQARKSMR